jgi:hypothetical protein
MRRGKGRIDRDNFDETCPEKIPTDIVKVYSMDGDSDVVSYFASENCVGPMQLAELIRTCVYHKDAAQRVKGFPERWRHPGWRPRAMHAALHDMFC